MRHLRISPQNDCVSFSETVQKAEYPIVVYVYAVDVSRPSWLLDMTRTSSAERPRYRLEMVLIVTPNTSANQPQNIQNPDGEAQPGSRRYA